MDNTDNILDSIYECLTFIDEETHVSSIASGPIEEQFETANTSFDSSMEIATMEPKDVNDPRHHWCVDQTDLIEALVRRFDLPVHEFKSGALFPYIEPQIKGFPFRIRNVEQESLWCYCNGFNTKTAEFARPWTSTVEVNYIINGQYCTAMNREFFFDIVERFLECDSDFE